jgi:hypothetical protein
MGPQSAFLDADAVTCHRRVEAIAEGRETRPSTFNITLFTTSDAELELSSGASEELIMPSEAMIPRIAVQALRIPDRVAVSPRSNPAKVRDPLLFPLGSE